MSTNHNKPSSIILNVDDNKSIRYARGRTLSKAGYHIIEAETGEDALRLAATKKPNLILLDVSLPDLNGLEVCRRLKAHKDTSHIMILQVSAAHTSKMDVAAGLEGGADSYLVEPINQLELLATVRALLRLADRENENRLLIQQLRRMEQQFADATNAADCGMWDWDIATGKLEWFGAHERLAGMLPGGFSGKVDAFSEVLHPDDRPRVWSKVQALIDQQKELFWDEYRFVHPDGSVHWMTASGRFFYEETGQAVRMTGVVQDITKRKQTEELSKLLDRALMASDAGVLIVDATASDHPIIFANSGFERLTGYQRNEVLGRNCRFLQGPETDRTQVRRIRAALEAGESIRLVLLNYRKDGTAFWNDLSISSVHDDAGHLTHFVGTQNDVTALIDTQHALCESEERLRLALDSADMGSWDLDLQTGVAIWNRRHAELQGYDEGGPHSFEQWHDRVHPDDLHRVLAAIEQAKESRTPFMAEHRVCLPESDQTTWLSLYGRFIYDEAGQPIRFSGVSLDITNRKQSDTALFESEQRLRLATEVAAIGIWEWNVVTNDVHWDAQMFVIYGISPTLDGMVSYRTWKDAVMPEDLPEQERVLRQIIQSKGQSGRGFRITRQNDGACRYIEAVETVRLNEQGEAEWVVGTNVDVTERHQAKDALQAAHDTFRHLVEQSPFGVYTVDADFRLAQVSFGARKGFEQIRPLVGRDLAEVLHILWTESFASEAIARFRHTLNTGEPYRSSDMVEQRHDSGEIESYDWRIERVVLPDGRFGVVCHFYDLSERHRYEQQLAEAKQQLEGTLSATEVGMWHWDLTDNRLVTDENLKRLFGINESVDLPAEAYTQRIHPDDFALNQDAIETVIRNGGAYDQQFRVIHPNGSVRWLHSRGKVEAATQRRRSFVGIVLDITERKNAEKQLQESEERLSLALQASSTGVWDWDLQTDEVTWTGHIHQIFGVDHFEGTREAFSRQVHPDDAGRLWTEVKRCIDEHLPFEAEFRIIRPSGEVRWVNNFGKVSYDEHGIAMRLLGTVGDITERKVAYQELQQLKNELEVRVRERTKDLLATHERLMATTMQLSLTEQRERQKLARDLHDHLAQMLIVGQMKTKLLKKQVPTASAATTMLEELSQVFQQALTYTRTLIAELSPPSLHDAGLLAALQWLGEQFLKDGLRVNVQANCTSVPLPEAQAVVMFQVVRELLFNVMKHAGVSEATVSMVREDDVLRVSVIDKGRGSSLEALQGSSQPGHLGLVSVRDRLQAMGGGIEVVSDLGEGTTVTLVLPIEGLKVTLKSE